MDIISEYEHLAATDQWSEALPLIEFIVSMNPGITTSWFNYGVCLDALGRHGDAANSFLRAYEIDPCNNGAQYRVFRSLALDSNERTFSKLLEEELERTPEIAELLEEDEVFRKIISRPNVSRVLQQYSARN